MNTSYIPWSRSRSSHIKTIEIMPFASLHPEVQASIEQHLTWRPDTVKYDRAINGATIWVDTNGLEAQYEITT